VVGVSTSPICGVRDHADLLADALARQGIGCSLHWLSHSPGSLRGSAARMRAWTAALREELEGEPPDAILLHYSVFAYSHRGVPLFVHPTLSALRRARGVPLLTVLHEFAYPWRRRGWRGAAWALTQRALLVDVMRASTALILTADFQERWVVSRAWLPGRRTVVAPVFSNLPAADVGPPAERARPVVGLFGYSAEGAAVSLTLDAVRLLADRGVPVELSLLGAPGAESPAGEMWLRAAHARGVAGALSFSGIQEPQALADALGSCEVLLFAETAGPTTRKTTLAASLVAGRPVLAIDGPSAWPELARAQAAVIVSPSASALAGALGEMLADSALRETQGARGRAFAEERMSATGNARIVGALLEEAVLSGAPRRA
jgi:glycosyltransferase involved in cell wall biosynthesis